MLLGTESTSLPIPTEGQSLLSSPIFMPVYFSGEDFEKQLKK
jgi:hypothetical protein